MNMILNYSYRNYSLDHVNLYIYICVFQPRATYHNKPKTYLLRGPEKAPNPYIYMMDNTVSLNIWEWILWSAFSRPRPQIGMSIFSINNLFFWGPIWTQAHTGPYPYDRLSLSILLFLVTIIIILAMFCLLLLFLLFHVLSKPGDIFIA